MMKLSTIKELLDAEILCGDVENVEITTACGSDLMSDVLAFVKERGLLLTGLTNLQVIRTAEMMDVVAVCFVRGKTPGEDVLELAQETGLVIIKTKYPLYIACGRLYHAGLMLPKGD